MSAQGHCSAQVLLSATENVHCQAGDAAQLGMQNLLGSQKHDAGCPGGHEQPVSAGPGALSPGCSWRCNKGRLHTERKIRSVAAQGTAWTLLAQNYQQGVP